MVTKIITVRSFECESHKRVFNFVTIVDPFQYGCKGSVEKSTVFESTDKECTNGVYSSLLSRYDYSYLPRKVIPRDLLRIKEEKSKRYDRGPYWEGNT